jgi:hypothetical protein
MTTESTPKKVSLRELGIMALICAGSLVLIALAPHGSGRTNEARARAQVMALRVILEAYHADWGGYPEQAVAAELSAGFYSALKSPDNRWYIDNTQINLRTDDTHTYVDPWGRPFSYRYPGLRDPAAFEVWSVGANGEPGEFDALPFAPDEDDIVSWDRR